MLFRLQAKVYQLKQEEKRLTEHIQLLKEQELQLQVGDDQFQAIRKKERELAEVWANFCN